MKKNEDKTNKRVKRLEKEFFDFKANVSNYLLTKIDGYNEDIEVSNPIYTDSTNNISSKNFSSQDTVKNNNQYVYNTESNESDERKMYNNVVIDNEEFEEDSEEDRTSNTENTSELKSENKQ